MRRIQLSLGFTQVAGLVVRSIPDITRYLKIRAM